MIKVRAAPGFAGKKASPSLREWAGRLKVPLVDPDVEEALAAAHIGYEDERVPLQGVGAAPPPIEEGWIAVEDPGYGGFAIGYVWRGPRVRRGRGLAAAGGDFRGLGCPGREAALGL
jgi:hypothetical protein